MHYINKEYLIRDQRRGYILPGIWLLCPEFTWCGLPQRFQLVRVLNSQTKYVFNCARVRQVRLLCYLCTQIGGNRCLYIPIRSERAPVSC